MRKFADIAVSLAVLMLAAPAHADDNQFDFDYMSLFNVANENCVGQSYNKAAILKHMITLGHAMGWSTDKTEVEIEIAAMKDYRSFKEDDVAFCAAANSSRDKYKDIIN